MRRKQKERAVKTGAAVAAGLSAAAVLMLAVFAFSPAKAEGDAPPLESTAITAVQPCVDAAEAPPVAAPQKSARLRAKKLLRALWHALGAILTAAASLLIKAGGALATGLLGKSAGGLLGFALAEWLPALCTTVFLFCALFKLLFPNVKLRCFLTPRNLALLCGGSVVLALCSRLYSGMERPLVAAQLNLLTGVAVMALLWYLLFRVGLKTPQGMIASLRAPRTYALLAGAVLAAGLWGYAQLLLIEAGRDAASVIAYGNWGLLCLSMIGTLSLLYKKHRTHLTFVHREKQS